MFRVQTQNVTFEATVYKAKAADVWEFVADFSNMKKLNPTILDFNIVAERGNYDHWQYSAEYTEFLSSFPFIRNFIVSHFSVKPDKEGSYTIESTHSSCFYTRLACLSSESEFRFYPVETGTRCVENVTYECPFLFSTLCYREVMYQRKEIMSNLQKLLSPSKMETKSM